jgi:putative tryptophan/tyrosine transport system substrate-binding protein
MNRRAFVTGLGAALAAPRATGAQQPSGRTPHVGLLQPGSAAAPISIRSAKHFTQGLRDHGYVDGKNITIEYRYANLDDNRLRLLANELVRLNLDVIIVGGTQAALAAKQATQTIPIVVAVMADPVADGLVATLAHPGGNITGVTFLAPELTPKRLQLLREIIPHLSRLAVLQHPSVYSEATMRNLRTEIEASARPLGIQVQLFEAKAPSDFDAAFTAMARARAEAMILFSSPMFYLEHRRLVEAATKNRLPTMYYFLEAIQAGGLISYGVDIPSLFQPAARHVGKILRGMNPGDIPVERPTTFELAINVKTAKSLGLTIPQSLLLRADQVIE